MPNHIKNRLEIFGSDQEVADVLNFLHGEPWEDGTERLIDFNKIVPMPKELEISAEAGIETMVEVALKMAPHNNLLIASLEMNNRNRSESPLKLSDEKWALFIQMLQNMKKHGHMSWYTWCCEKWGTKWNAYSQKKLSPNTLEWETAWSNVLGLIEKLSLKFPQVKFGYEYADEDTGSNCGSGEVKGGVSQMRKIESQSTEAYDLAFKLRPDSKKYYKLVNGKYEYQDEGEYIQ